MPLDKEARTTLVECPLECEKLRELSEGRDLIGTDALGWVSDDDELERSRAVIQASRMV